MKIVVLTGGFVMACRELIYAADAVELYTVRTIRVWGTSEGLGQLTRGPTKDTKLDAMIPVVSAPRHALIFEFEVTDAWDKHLK